MAQIYYEDVEIGAELPTMTKKPTTRQLVKWAGASQDWNELHYDKDAAQKGGLPNVIVQGHLTSSFLTQLITDWMGEDGFVKKMEVKWRQFHFPGQEVLCKGKVSEKLDGNTVLVDIWTEVDGTIYAPHKATVVLPSKG